MHYSQPHIVTIVFNEVNKILNQWLSPALYEEHKKQICESTTYRAQITDLFNILAEEVDKDDLPYPINNNEESNNNANGYFVEDNYEDRKIYIKQVIAELNREDIKQI